MPAETKTAPIEEESILAGKFYKCDNEADRSEAIDKAFDFRGNVILELTGGEKVEGYMGNRDGKIVYMWPKGEEDERHVDYGAITAIAFDSKDPADGKSWENWMAKKADERKAEADLIEQESRARGEL